MKNLSFLLFILFLSSFSCRKEEDPLPPPPPPQDISKPIVVWKSFLNDQKMSCSSFPTVLSKDFVIFGSERYGVTESMTISAYKKKDGTRVWSWNEWAKLYAFTLDYTELATRQNHLFLTQARELHKVDMTNGKTEWNNFLTADAGGENRVSIFGNMFFTTHDDRNDDFSALVRCHVDQFRGWDTIYASHRGADGNTPNYCSPSAALAPWGDTLVVFQDRSPNFKTGIGKITMYAYNLTADSLLWKTPLNQRNSNVALPLIERDRVYFQASDRVYCFDLFTGKVQWSQDFGGGKGFLTTNLLIIDDKLICGPHDIELIAVNKLTGQPIWWNYSSGGSRNYMVHHKGRIYFTAKGSAKLHCVDAQTGQNIFAERPPTATEDDRASFFESEIVIDPETGLLYTHDRFHALCLKLPD